MLKLNKQVKRAKERLGWAGLFVSLLLMGCQSVQTTRSGAVGVERKQTMSTLAPSSAQIDASSRQQYAQVLAAASKKGALNRDPKQVERVRLIAQRLTPHTVVFRDDAPGWQWEVNVLSVDQVNAWCMPGGKIAVYTGLIDKLKLTDDELAAVMGHEIGHALREHARERMGRAAPVQLGAAVVGALYGQMWGSLSGSIFEAAVVLPNSRENEQESDRIGVELAARAGYDPRAAITLWQKMGSASGGSAPPQWLSTHPSNESRIRDLQDYAGRVMPLYQQAAGKK